MEGATGQKPTLPDADKPAPIPGLSPVQEFPKRWPEQGAEAEYFTPDAQQSYSLHGMTLTRDSSQPCSRDRSTSLPFVDAGLNGSLNDLPESQSRRRSTAGNSTTSQGSRRGVRKLSSAQVEELMSSPDAVPVRAASPSNEDRPYISPSVLATKEQDEQKENITPPKDRTPSDNSAVAFKTRPKASSRTLSSPTRLNGAADVRRYRDLFDDLVDRNANPVWIRKSRLGSAPRRTSWRHDQARANSTLADTTPIPPSSMPTHLHLELSSSRPSPLYIQPSADIDMPFESTKIKLERLVNFLILPPKLEFILFFGVLTCLDAWLYTFTILPLRFVKALWILGDWVLKYFFEQGRSLGLHVRKSISKQRRSSRAHTEATMDDLRNQAASSLANGTVNHHLPTAESNVSEHVPTLRRKAPSISTLQASHKADILQGFLIIISCALLMRFDASRMYHAIRGQAAIKLYVIYNMLEVFDRLFSALGQDIIECLFSREVLERKSNGRSKVARPFWMFLLALAYTVIHATALLYQVVTLNVAVNSYSNALLTLLMSNQFVEIKGTVFKKFEKESLFQLTCADIVERFQLWLMLLTIALRNIVEIGGLSLTSTDFMQSSPSSTSTAAPNSTASAPHRTFNILPHAFTLLPTSFFPTTRMVQVLAPFLIVVGSEMLVDWLKHAYITKFNATPPSIYSRFLDVLSRDYYSNAFAQQNLTRRLGLPTIPLAVLFIRASLQTYQMWVATNVGSSLGEGMSTATNTTATSLALQDIAENATPSPIFAQIDHIFRSALGRSAFGAGRDMGDSGWRSWTFDDAIALTTMLVFFLAIFLILLACKLALGIVLLRYARGRYAGMKMRERERERAKETERNEKEKDRRRSSNADSATKSNRNARPEVGRLGPFGNVEVGDERRKAIYEDDEIGLKRAREMESKGVKQRAQWVLDDDCKGLDRVERYSMAGKRIW